jgi:hypothetical protein
LSAHLLVLVYAYDTITVKWYIRRNLQQTFVESIFLNLKNSRDKNSLHTIMTVTLLHDT